MSQELKLIANELAEAGRSLFDRGLAHGAAGNISAKLGNQILLSPTGVSLGKLDPTNLSLIDITGQHLSGPPPTKELALHLALYQKRPRAGAIIHLHASHSVAVSCMDGLDRENAVPPLTAYYVMRIGRLPLLPFFPPGDAEMALAVGETARVSHAMLLANHGPIVAGPDIAGALANIEELEATARLQLLLAGHKTLPLTDDQINRLEERFGQAGCDC